MNNQRNNWVTSILLSIPIIIFFAGYLFNHDASLHPTGFIQYDNVAYIAYAKQYLDSDSFNLFYSNPFALDGPAIYFQPQTIFFALLLKTGIPAGWILIPFSLICSVIVFRILIGIYDYLSPNSLFRKWNLWLLCWGGGLLVVAGIAAHYYIGRPGPLYRDLFMVDPEGGWWGLNLGRSLVFSCEAYYHALFLGCILSVLKKNWKTAVALMLLLSLSHPFTGLELAAIICAWNIFEFLSKKKEVPVWFGIVSVLILAFHLYYYLIYLEQFPDHQSVSSQYSLNWRLRFYRMIPAYLLVGALAIISFFNKGLRNFFAIRNNRILFAWFLVAFLLANHEIFTSPKQPVHFTRGYIWLSLFLIGLPALIRLNNYISTRWKAYGWVAIAVIFFADNFLWFTINSTKTSTQEDATYISSEHKNILTVLNQETNNRTLIISQDNTLSYLSSVFTKGTPWYSHPFTTPNAKLKKSQQDIFFTTGHIPDDWKRKNVAFIVHRTDTVAINILVSQNASESFSAGESVIFLFRSL